MNTQAKRLSKFYKKLAKNDNGIRYMTDSGEWIPTTDERFYPGFLCTLDNYLVNPPQPGIACDSCLHDSRYINCSEPAKCLMCDDNFSMWEQR